jgi:hypothetical protein
LFWHSNVKWVNQMQKNKLRFIACLVFIQLAFACFANGAQPEYRVTSKIIPFAKGEKEKFKLKVIQPYQMKLASIKRSMARLAYQNKNFSWSNKKRVFPSTFIHQLAPQIVDQMSKAHDGQHVTYQIESYAGKILLRGDTFLTTKGLHWRITVLNGKRRKVSDFSITGESWKLTPLKDQAYETRRPFKNLVQDMTNWIVFQNIRPEQSKRLPVPIQQNEKQSPKIMEKLQLLEELKEDGIIEDKEYEAKRKKLLK